MAFYNEEDEEEEQQGPQTTGAESGVVGSGAGGADAAQAATADDGAQSKPESFVGISQYINANKPQSQKLASQVVGNINTKAQGVDTALSSAENSFNQAADSQKVEADDALFDQVKTNATAVTADPNKVSQFTKLRNASYQGPQDLQSFDNGSAWGNIQSALGKAKTAKSQAGTEEGRMGLIKEISNNPRQSQGALVFDNLLLQSNPNSAEMLKNAGSSLNDIDARLAQGQTAAQAKAKEIADANAAVKNSAKGALQTGYQNFTGDLASREAAKDAEQQAAFEAAQESLDYRNLPDNLLAELGLRAGQNIYRTNLADYLTRQDTANAKTLATDDDYARQAALLELMGEDAISNPLLNPTVDRELMGQVGSGYGYDKSGVAQNVDKERAALTSELSNTLDKYGIDYLTPEQLANDPEGMIERFGSNPENTPFIRDLMGLYNKYKANRKINTYTPGGMTGPMGSGV